MIIIMIFHFMLHIDIVNIIQRNNSTIADFNGSSDSSLISSLDPILALPSLISISHHINGRCISFQYSYLYKMKI